MTVAMFMAMARRAAPRLLLVLPGTWRLALESAGEKPIQVIKVLRELTGMDLLSAKTAVESAPTEVGSGLSEAYARRGAQLLNRAGATAVADPTP